MGSKRPIRVCFLDYYPRQPERQYHLDLLREDYEVIIDNESPEYVIDGGNGHEHLDPRFDRAIKILSNAENSAPDFNLFDYAISFDVMQYGDRYIRHPLFAMYPEFARIGKQPQLPDEELLNRGFCSFVVSHLGGGDPMRAEFFHALSKYKKVDSGGGALNNIGGRVGDKDAFVRKHKFNIAFENSISSGYVTEKIVQAWAGHSLPIYYGDQAVLEDFNSDAFVYVKSRQDIQRAVEEIVYLDTHDDEYLRRLRLNPLRKSQDCYRGEIKAFWRHVIDQPIAEARRLVPYSYQVLYRRRIRRMHKIDDMWRVPALWVYNLKHKLISYKK